MSRSQDLFGVLKGLLSVVDAGAKLSDAELRLIWKNSNLNTVLRELPKAAPSTGIESVGDVANAIGESAGRFSAVLSGISEFTKYNVFPSETPKTTTYSQPKSRSPSSPPKSKPEETSGKDPSQKEPPPFKIQLTKSDKELLKKLDKEHREKMAREFSKQAYLHEIVDAGKTVAEEEQAVPQYKAGDVKHEKDSENSDPSAVKAVPNPKSKQTLSKNAKQRTVPSSRIGRMVSFGSLAAGLGIGSLAEYTKRTLGFKEDDDPATIFLNKANMERIVDTLCKVRGAALKIGQILSIQDESVINPELAKALERVRKSADFMPLWQLEKVMLGELGSNWRQKFGEFNDVPFAAASIGQVHWGKTHDGSEVAVKIQYPGVAQGIESDIDNLIGVMKVWNIFPPGMFIDNIVTVAKRELAWEVDYFREAVCTRKFKELLKPYPYYYVPSVEDDLSTKQVFTTELVDGIPVDHCTDLSAEDRNYIATKVLELVLREIMEFQYMQTDPNWANFFYDAKTKKMVLLDFGATRAYSKKFADNYVKVMKAASEADRNTILAYSRELGFFTGYESKIMEEAHVDAVMIIGEVFRAPGVYDFGHQNTSERIQQLVPTMLAHRLCPPPEEIYSLHRKISGVFLLAAKLKAVVPARQLFLDLYDRYRFEY